MKKLLRKIPIIRWLDDFTDTPFGENLCWAIIIFFVLLLIAYVTASGLPRRLP